MLFPDPAGPSIVTIIEERLMPFGKLRIGRAEGSPTDWRFPRQRYSKEGPVSLLLRQKNDRFRTSGRVAFEVSEGEFYLLHLKS